MVGRDDLIAEAPQELASLLRREARALAELRGVAGPELDETLDALERHLAVYAELVLAEHGIEIITGGVGASVARDLARIAVERGGLWASADAFLSCAAAFPSTMLGLKIGLGPPHAPPTLYVRTLASRDTVMAFLDTLPEVAPAIRALAGALAGNRTVYGLGFTSRNGRLELKTYTIADVAVLGSDPRTGFVSYRVVDGEVTREVKRYLPDLDWDELPISSDDVARARERIACGRVGHLGVIEVEGRAPEVKLYLERIGAIPSDFTAR